MTEKEMFSFHEKEVAVECTDGTILSGLCWCYSEIHAQLVENLPEAYIEVGSTVIFLSEIKSIRKL